jgi:serine protease Do
MAETEQPKETARTKQRLHLSVIFFCFIAGFLGSAAYANTGLIHNSDSQTATQNQPKIVSAEGEIMASLAKKVSPSVVSVTTESVTDLGQRSVLSEGAGTGIIISQNGYIMTNKHVVQDARNVTVVGSDGTVYRDVELVGADPLNDIAFLKIKGDKNDFNAARLGDSNLVEVGQKVISIGNALGQYQNSVTSGIISGRGRPVVADNGASGEQLDNLLQTDAAINPGNSGGPLLNLSGEVIGMNTAIAQDAQGIGFAIPINAAKGLVKSVLANNGVKRAFLGVRYLNITSQVAATYKLSVKKGAYVFNDDGAGVVPGSPADKAGIKNGDVITKVNNQVIDEDNGLSLLVSPYAPGDKVSLTLLRNGATKTVEVTLEEYSAH